MMKNTTFDSLARTPPDQHGLRGMIKKHFFSLSEIYKHYAASNSALGAAHEIDAVELGIFLEGIELYPSSKSLKEVQRTRLGQYPRHCSFSIAVVNQILPDPLHFPNS